MALVFTFIMIKLVAVLLLAFFFLRWLFNKAAIDADEQKPCEKKSFTDIVLVRINRDAHAASVFYGRCVLAVGIVAAAAILISV